FAFDTFPSLARKIGLASLLLLAALAPAAEAAKPPGVLGISPPRRIVVARPPVTLEPTLVQNTTQFDFDVTVTRGLLAQRLDGSFELDKSPRNVRAAQLILDTAPTKFKLPRNRQVQLRFRWANLPRGTRAAYVGLLVQGVPKAKRGAGVASILRLLGTNFLRLPGPYRSSAEIVLIRGEQAGPKRLQFFTRVKNTGQVSDSPKSAHTIIEDSTGKHLVKLNWPLGVILPGYAREYPVLLKRVLPAGHYFAVSSMRFGRPARISVKRYPFTLTGPNQLPTRDLSLTSVGLSGSIGDAAHVTATVKNTGTAKSPVVLGVTLYRLPANGASAIELSSLKRPGGQLDVKGGRSYSFDLGHLAKANYRATVVVTDGRTKFDEKSANLSPRKRESLPTRIWNWISDNLPWLLLIFAIAAILLLLLLLRRRRGDDDEEPGAPAVASTPAPAPVAPAAVAPARKPAPPPPPTATTPAATGGRVNLNSAAMDDLMTLPGIGRRAAERLIAHREANGPFTSLDELHAVEGFHEERIQRITDHAEL
ncbi:MAG: competence protein ComEA, partial [Thermoleophilaceae bacterium]|nr:competence protein ComEA [Thermoleophilaceae bacterium]